MGNTSFGWTCPHCSMVQTVTNDKHSTTTTSLEISGQAEGPIAISTIAIGCSNQACLRTTVHATVAACSWTHNGYSSDLRLKAGEKPLFKQYLCPQGTAKPQPEYIPKAIRDDYHEACLIRDLSPKASATLVRRCLQGMIRHFAKITDKSLYQEIQRLKDAVQDGTADRAISEESVQAIDHVRGIGNIGAHMEKDIDQIIDVDPGEAQALIELVEMLFDEWYGARARRAARLADISLIADQKAAQKQLAAPASVQARDQTVPATDAE